MSAPQYFFNPFTGSIPTHFGGIVPIVNPVGPPTFVAIGHNGFQPVTRQIHVAPVAHVSHVSHARSYRSDYDFVTVLVITKRPDGKYEILLPTSGNSIQLNCRRINHGDDPDALLARMIDDYGLTHFGKLSKIRHVEHSTGQIYKIAIVYAPMVSRTRINASYSSRHHHVNSLQRYFLPKHRASAMLRDNYGKDRSIDFGTCNTIYAIANVLHDLVY